MLRPSMEDKLGGGDEVLFGVGRGEIGEVLQGGAHIGASGVHRVIHRVGAGEDGAHTVGLIRRIVGEGVDEPAAGGFVGAVAVADRGEGPLAEVGVAADGFSQFIFRAVEIEEVVDDLEGHAEIEAKGGHPVDDAGRGAGGGRAEFAADAGERGGFAADDFQVLRFGQAGVIAMFDLHQFAFADGVGHIGNAPREIDGAEAGAQVIRMGNQIVAEQNGALVADEAVERGLSPADVGFVEDVVVDQRRHVDHLDDGGEDHVFPANVADRLGREQEQLWAEQLPAILPNLIDQPLDEGQIAAQLVIEGPNDLFEGGGDGTGQVEPGF